MANILLDTHIFRQLTREYESLMNCIGITGDIIITSPEIDREYEGRLAPSGLALMGYKEEIGKKCRIRPIHSGRIESKFNQYQSTHNVYLPKHSKDEKWVKTAISEQAKYIISNDGDLKIKEFPVNGHTCRSIYPGTYISENCEERTRK